MTHAIGLMSGTSLDGVDGVVLHQPPDAAPRVLAHVHHAFQADLRCALQALQSPGENELHRAALASNGLARAYASVVHALVAKASVSSLSLRVVGAHGQTVRHQPGLHDGTGYTLQVLNGALLAELTSMDVVCDLRSRDVAAGGQGAPLVPAFHQAAFARADAHVAVLNIGGMANASLLAPGADPLGFDTGPGGALLDGWCARHRHTAYDEDGLWAASGRVDLDLLSLLVADPFFGQGPPKSTGRERFDMHWVDAALNAHRRPIAPVDVQATLSELTARTAARAIVEHLPQVAHVIVCGGGARNSDLMQRLGRCLAHARPGTGLMTSDALGLPVDQVEAAAFAWLALRFVERKPGNVPAVTGAKGPRVLGALHPGA